MLFLTERDIQDLLPMSAALECVAASFAAQHTGRGINRARQRIFLPTTSLHYMAAGYEDEKLVGMKVYTVSGGALRFLVLLFDGAGGDLLALIEADHLGRIRTGAASGVATRYMARADATRVGVIGTGRQARTQLRAVAEVRRLEGVRAYGRDPARLKSFAAEMSTALAVPVEPADTAESAVQFGDIVITATSSRDPVVKGSWLRPGTHVNAIGANMLNRRELDDESLARAGVIAVDSIEQARQEAGDLVQGLDAIRDGWESVIEMHEIVAGVRPGRNSESDITIFKSSGIALWDVMVAGFVYGEALKHGRGREIPLWHE